MEEKILDLIIEYSRSAHNLRQVATTLHDPIEQADVYWSSVGKAQAYETVARDLENLLKGKE